MVPPGLEQLLYKRISRKIWWRTFTAVASFTLLGFLGLFQLAENTYDRAAALLNTLVVEQFSERRIAATVTAAAEGEAREIIAARVEPAVIAFGRSAEDKLARLDKEYREAAQKIAAMAKPPKMVYMTSDDEIRPDRTIRTFRFGVTKPQLLGLVDFLVQVTTGNCVITNVDPKIGHASGPSAILKPGRALYVSFTPLEAGYVALQVGVSGTCTIMITSKQMDMPVESNFTRESVQEE